MTRYETKEEFTARRERFLESDINEIFDVESREDGMGPYGRPGIVVGGHTKSKTRERTFPFSNFQPAHIEHRGIEYMNVETFYQAMKSLDPEVQEKISHMKPGEAKKYSRTIEVRDDWEDIKDQVMMFALRQKFAPGTYWSNRLKETPDALLVEENWWHDNYWGTCLCEKCGDEGLNKLGNMVRQLKDELLGGSR